MKRFRLKINWRNLKCVKRRIKIYLLHWLHKLQMSSNRLQKLCFSQLDRMSKHFSTLPSSLGQLINPINLGCESILFKIRKIKGRFMIMAEDWLCSNLEWNLRGKMVIVLNCKTSKMLTLKPKSEFFSLNKRLKPKCCKLSFNEDLICMKIEGKIIVVLGKNSTECKASKTWNPIFWKFALKVWKSDKMGIIICIEFNPSKSNSTSSRFRFGKIFILLLATKVSKVEGQSKLCNKFCGCIKSFCPVWKLIPLITIKSS